MPDKPSKSPASSRYGQDDFYKAKARAENVPARSYFKLEQMDKELDLFREGDKVLDLGCYPGSWTLYAARHIGTTGRVLGIDTKEVTIALPANAKTRIQDAQYFLQQDAKVPPLNIIISDMAPHTIGDYSTSHWESADLVNLVIDIAATKLLPGGCMLAKLFDGGERNKILDRMNTLFKECKVLRPDAVRKESFELYIAGLVRKEVDTQVPLLYRPPEPKSRPKPSVPQDFSGW